MAEEHDLITREFNGSPIQMIQMASDLWVTGEAIGGALGYAEGAKAIAKVYERNRQELENYSCTVKLTVQGGSGTEQRRSVRVFNEEGVMVVTMLSRQPKAAEFRAWAVKILKAYRHGELVLSEPGKRDHLLEMAICEAGKGNIAALDTLIERYGYNPKIKDEQLRLVRIRYGRGDTPEDGPLPEFVRWFVGHFLADLRHELTSGEMGEATEALTRLGIVLGADDDGARYVEYQTSHLLQAVSPLAPGMGAVNARNFGEWLARVDDELQAAGWRRETSRIVHGRTLYRLILLRPS